MIAIACGCASSFYEMQAGIGLESTSLTEGGVK